MQTTAAGHASSLKFGAFDTSTSISSICIRHTFKVAIFYDLGNVVGNGAAAGFRCQIIYV